MAVVGRLFSSTSKCVTKSAVVASHERPAYMTVGVMLKQPLRLPYTADSCRRAATTHRRLWPIADPSLPAHATCAYLLLWLMLQYEEVGGKSKVPTAIRTPCLRWSLLIFDAIHTATPGVFHPHLITLKCVQPAGDLLDLLLHHALPVCWGLCDHR